MRSAVVLVLVLNGLASAKDRTWLTGKLTDSRSVKTTVNRGSVTHADSNARTTGAIDNSGSVDLSTSASSTAQTIPLSDTVTDTQYLIIGEQYILTVEDIVKKREGGGLLGAARNAVVNSRHGCRLIVNDSVRYAQEKSTVYVIDADGKECKMNLIRQERIQAK